MTTAPRPVRAFRAGLKPPERRPYNTPPAIVILRLGEGRAELHVTTTDHEHHDLDLATGANLYAVLAVDQIHHATLQTIDTDDRGAIAIYTPDGELEILAGDHHRTIWSTTP